MSVEIEHKSLVARDSWQGQAEHHHMVDVLKPFIAWS
jgi:CYTH domain-containing protein